MVRKLGSPTNRVSTRQIGKDNTAKQAAGLLDVSQAGAGRYLDVATPILSNARSTLPSLSHNKGLQHIAPIDGVDVMRAERGAVDALVDFWAERLNQLGKDLPMGALEDYTYSHQIFAGPYESEALKEPFFPKELAVGDGRVMQRLGVGFGRAVFSIGDKAIKTTWKTSQAEMREEVTKYQKSLEKLRALGEGGQFVLDRIVPITQSFEVPASSFADKVQAVIPPDDRVFIVMDKLSAPTLKASMEATLEDDEFPAFSKADLRELAQLFHDSAQAGILLQGDAADFVYDEKAPEGKRLMAIDPAGWTLFDSNSRDDKDLVAHLSAKSFVGTFLRELGKVPMPAGDTLEFEPNFYDPKYDDDLEKLKTSVSEVVREIWGDTAERPTRAEKGLQAAMAGDMLANPYIREMVVFEFEDPRALAEALVHCGIGVVVTHREVMEQMHELRESQLNPRTSSAQDGRQMKWADTTSIGFGNQQGFVDDKSGFAAFINPYNSGNPDGSSIEEQRPHVPWHFVNPADVAQAMLQRLSKAGSVKGEPVRSWFDRG